MSKSQVICTIELPSGEEVEAVARFNFNGDEPSSSIVMLAAATAVANAMKAVGMVFGIEPDEGAAA